MKRQVAPPELVFTVFILSINNKSRWDFKIVPLGTDC